MYAQVENKNKSQMFTNVNSLNQSCWKAGFQFVDNRPETIAQRNLKAAANNSPQTMEVTQLQTHDTKTIQLQTENMGSTNQFVSLLGKQFVQRQVTSQEVTGLSRYANQIVQRVLDTEDVTHSLDRVSGGKYKNRVEELADLVKSYNETHDEHSNSEESIQGQLQKLYEIENKANVLLNEHALPIDGRQKLFNFLASTQKQQVDLIDRTLKHKVDLWMPEGTSMMDNQDAQVLWKSLSGQNKSKGNIKIVTKNEDFRKRTNANFAQLLQGKAGRGLLKDLNKKGKRKRKRGVNKHVIISDDMHTNFPNLTANLSQNGSYAEPYARANNGQDHHTENNGQPNVGTGAYVQIEELEEPTLMDDRLMGVNGEAIHTPEFVTLGHELGHAQAHLHGRTQSLFPSGDDHESTVWSNQEEHRNITQVENNIRKEHGIAPRKYHHTIGSVRHDKYKKRFDTEMEQIWQLVPQPLQGRINTEVANFGSLSLEINQNVDFSQKSNVRKMSHKLLKVRNDVTKFVENPPLQLDQRQQAHQPAQHGGGGILSWLGSFIS